MNRAQRKAEERRRAVMKQRLESNRERRRKAERDAATAAKEAVGLRKELERMRAEAERIYTAYCATCDRKVEMMLNFGEDGYVFFCPYCGAKMFFCVDCYFDQKGKEETMEEYVVRKGCDVPDLACMYVKKRKEPRV